jgi:hypothetical protein
MKTKMKIKSQNSQGDQCLLEIVGKRKQKQSDQRRTNGRIVPTADPTIIINNYKGPLRQPFN